MKKFLSVMLVLCMLVCLMSTSVFAVEVTVRVGDFIVTADRGENGGDFTYNFASRTLKITKYGVYTISNAESERPTQDRIEVAVENGASVTLNLVNVNIDVSGEANAAAVNIVGGGSVIVDFAGENVLKSGENRAGLEKGNSGGLTLNSTKGGALEAYGGYCAAGIGGGTRKGVQAIVINGGRVKAQGGAAKKIRVTDAKGKVTESTWGNESTAGAGIGGGNLGNGENIRIYGTADVTAIGGHWAAGIGGGRGGDAKDIYIAGGAKVKATGGYRSPGIGAGRSGKLTGLIKISGQSNVEAIGRGDTAPGIGFGEGGSVTTEARLEILNEAQVKAQGAPIRKDTAGKEISKTGGVGVSCRIEKIDATARLTRVGRDSTQPVVAAATPVTAGPAAAAAAALPRPSDTVRSALDAADADLQPGCVVPQYVGIKNRDHDCPVISAVQLLYQNVEFRNLILQSKTRSDFINALKRQFEQLNRGEVDRLVFEDALIEELKQDPDNYDFAGNISYDGAGNLLASIKWAETEILRRCSEEGGDTIKNKVREIYDYNCGSGERLEFVRSLGIGAEATITETVFQNALNDKHIPKEVNLGDEFCMWRKAGFDANLEFTVKDNEGKDVTLELTKVLMKSEGHYYVYVKDIDSGNWIEVNDNYVEVLILEGKDFGDSRVLQYCFTRK